MPLREGFLSAAFALALAGWAGAAGAQDGEPVVIEVFVDSASGQTEIVCPTTSCNAVCRDIEGSQVLLAGNYYRIGSNCSISISDGTLLQEAIETVLALIGDEVPGGPGQGQGTPATPTEFTNPESNPNQNNPGAASPVEP